MPIFKSVLPQVAVIFLPLVALAAWSQQSWRAELHRASELAEKNVAISREYILRAVQTADAAALQADLVTRGMEPSQIGTAGVHESLKRIDDVLDLPSGIGIIGRDGRHLASSMAFPVDNDLSDREYFTAVRDGAAAPFVGTPITTLISNLETIPISRPRGGSDGFSGVIVSNIAVSTLVNFFEKLKIDEDTIASVTRADGVLLARWPPMPSFKLGPETPFMRAAAQADQGTYRGIAAADGKDRLYAFAKVGNLPIYAVYGFSVSTLWDRWLNRFYVAAGFAALAITLLLMLMTRARAVQRHRDRLHQEVEARTAELKAALVEKNVLLREVHHRVKNNLAMMTSLVRIIGRAAPVDSQPYFRDIAQRITVVGKIYNQIHSAGDLSAFDAAAYLREVCGETVRALGSPVIRLRLDVAHMDIDIDTALPVGLIASELITNALKHAFEGRDRGELLVRAWQLDGTGFLTVADDGRGLPETIRSKAAGLGLAETLARQVDGTLKAAARPCGGTEFNLSFRLNRRRHSADAA